MAGLYGNPFPTMIETLGGSIAWKTAASFGLDRRASGRSSRCRRRSPREARRGSLELRRGDARSACAGSPLEKLAAHLTGMLIVMVVVARHDLAGRRRVRDAARATRSRR